MITPGTAWGLIPAYDREMVCLLAQTKTAVKGREETCRGGNAPCAYSTAVLTSRSDATGTILVIDPQGHNLGTTGMSPSL